MINPTFKSRKVLFYVLASTAIAVIVGSLSFAHDIEAIEAEKKAKRVLEYDKIEPFTEEIFKLPEEYSKWIGGYRSTWARLTGFEFSGLHWNHFVVIYVNKNPEVYASNYREYVKRYIDDEWDEWEEEEEEEEEGFKEYEEGTTFLKEHFVSNNGKPDENTQVTLMIKREPGYDPKYGNWEYVWIDGTNGNLIDKGNSANKNLFTSCIECHSNMAERDYVFSTFSRSTFKEE